VKASLTRRTLAAATAAAGVLALSACGGNVAGGSAESSEAFPSGPVTITVGQDAGGSTDRIARAIGEGMAEDLGVAVPVVNKAGANGALATKEVAGMEADGQNLILLNASLITITSLTVPEGEAVTLDDLDVIAGLSQDDYVLVASPESGFESLADIQDSGDPLNFGTTGVGTGSQLAQAVLFAQAEIDGTAVPFDSGSPALTAVMGDQVDVATIQLGEALPQIEAGTVTPIVTFAKERNEFLPDTPTAIEEGYEVPVSQYRALAAPKGLSEDVKARLVESVEATQGTEAYQTFNEENILAPWEVTGEEVTEEWNALAEQYKALVEEYDISLSGE
jgi:tripartite-type tricarboxylate transporter receptor subunit TctC